MALTLLFPPTGPGSIMELLFRKYFWTVNLLFILLAALLVARTVNQFTAVLIAPGANAGEARTTARPRAPELPANLDLERLAKLVGMPLPAPAPDVMEPEQQLADLNAEPVKSGLRLKLLGTLVAGDPEWSFASIQDMNTLKSTTYMVNDPIQGATVLEIERSRVIILNNGRKEFIDATGGDGVGAPVAMAPVVPTTTNTAPPQGNLGEGVRPTGENTYEVDRGEVDKTLSNLNQVAMQARIVPAFKDGVAQGFKLFSIRPNSIYSKIGVQNGDVIKRINGLDLNSPEKALEVYTKLKDSSRIDLELERNGTTLRKTYNIR